jgi:hypothetical protein
MKIPLRFAALLLAMASSAEEAALPAPRNPPKPVAFDLYVREPADRIWHLYFSGKVPVHAWAGAALIVHDAAGLIVHREVIPRGEYAENNPRVVTIPADSRTGDYRIVMVGHQIQFIGVCGRVWSDLPFEAVRVSTNDADRAYVSDRPDRWFRPDPKLPAAPFWKEAP